MRLARRYGYGGTRFVEDDLAADRGRRAGHRAGAAHHGPAAADLIGAGAAGLAAAQLPQDAAEYVRLDVLPRASSLLQIIGRPSDVERLLGEAGQRAQEVERGAAQAIQETAAVAAEEGEVAVAAEGVGGAFGYLGGLAEGAAALAPTVGGSWRGGNGAAGRGHCGRRSLRPRARHGLGAGEHALPAPAGQRGRGRAGRPVRQQHE